MNIALDDLPAWPIPPKSPAGNRIELDADGSSETSRLKTEIEPADTGVETYGRQFFHTDVAPPEMLWRDTIRPVGTPETLSELY